jgi:putative ABC transport system substrate-binding protein
MRRREFIAGLGVAVVLPVTAKSQPPTSLRRIGVLLVGFTSQSKAAQSFRRGLRDAGHFEGRNIVIEWREANGNYDHVSGLIADLVQRKVDAIVFDSTVATEMAKRATSTIPLVMALVLDPVGSGLVASLAHPGGNVTGLSMMTTVDLNSKRLQMLQEVIPRLTNAAVIYKTDHPLHVRAVSELQNLGPLLSINLSFVAVRAPNQFATALRKSAVQNRKPSTLSMTRCSFQIARRCWSWHTRHSCQPFTTCGVFQKKAP